MNWKPLALTALVVMTPIVEAGNAQSVISERNEMLSLTQQLERLKTEVEIEKTQNELKELRGEKNKRSKAPEPQPGMTPEMVRQEIEAAKREIAEQRRMRPRDKQLDHAYIEEAYQPQDMEDLEAILNVNGRLIKVQPGSEIGDWEVKQIELGRVEVFNGKEKETLIIGDGTSSTVKKNR